jgi:hypothetical protein
MYENAAPGASAKSLRNNLRFTPCGAGGTLELQRYRRPAPLRRQESPDLLAQLCQLHLHLQQTAHQL